MTHSVLVLKLHALLEASIDLWSVSGGIGPLPADSDQIVLWCADGPRVTVRPEPGDGLIRWWVDVDGSDGCRISRPCTSVLGVLSATRAALGADEAPQLRLRVGSGAAE